MVTNSPGADSDADSGGVRREGVELRAHVARSLQLRAAVIVEDTLAVYAFAGMERIAPDDRARFAGVICDLITHAVRECTLDSHDAAVADVGSMARDMNIGIRALFNVVYLMERSALDELAVEESFGATSEPWPVIAHMVRRASFDVCAACSETRDPGSPGIIDPLTTLHTKAVFLAALEKEIHRSERSGRPFALILLDVDRLAEINATRGYGTGDRVIERLGIVVRSHFRETDWVAWLSGGTFAVLLSETWRVDAERLADSMRIIVAERLQLHDYRLDQQFPVTVSVGVLIAESVDQSVRAEQLLTEAAAAVDRAKTAGRNRVERVDAVIGRAVTPTREEVSLD